ncbi:hypothetical protein CORC01_11639 [Colletotrichum orchidophilum]|uniref:Uncharacterized protein n=1 Tax=Colletotrichum orchidophilum TaxID=1209926 RepID=A0A1G4AVK3_9PEZI|nr:hypothetical protein CORC01_11639 [Colletotrichum orchidophilum]
MEPRRIKTSSVNSNLSRSKLLG